jgi:hypothetical protein
VLERSALRATVAPQPVVIQTPVPAPRAGVVECREHFAGKAVIADTGHGALHAPFVARLPDPRGVNVKVARLCVFEKGGGNPGRQWIGTDDDGLRVIRDQDPEDAAEKRPGRFTRLDRARRRFLEGRIDEAVPRAHGRKDPRAKSALLTLRQREPADPASIQLQLVARLAIEHRDRRRRLAKLQLEDREAVQRGIRDLDTLPDEQLANLGEAQAVAEPALDRCQLLMATRPPIARGRPPAGCSASRTWRTSSSLIVAVTRTPAIPAASRQRRTVFGSSPSSADSSIYCVLQQSTVSQCESHEVCWRKWSGTSTGVAPTSTLLARIASAVSRSC